MRLSPESADTMYCISTMPSDRKFNEKSHTIGYLRKKNYYFCNLNYMYMVNANDVVAPNIIEGNDVNEVWLTLPLINVAQNVAQNLRANIIKREGSDKTGKLIILTY